MLPQIVSLKVLNTHTKLLLYQLQDSKAAIIYRQLSYMY